MSRRPVPRKPAYERVVRINITLPPRLHQQVPDVIRKYGFANMSDYVQGRLRKDAGLELPA